jgi:hypothetical protein
VLPRRYCAVLLPLRQSGEYGHETSFSGQDCAPVVWARIYLSYIEAGRPRAGCA